MFFFYDITYITLLGENRIRHIRFNLMMNLESESGQKNKTGMSA